MVNTKKTHFCAVFILTIIHLNTTFINVKFKSEVYNGNERFYAG